MKLDELFITERPWLSLNEADYREITGMIDDNFLRQKVRRSLLKAIKFEQFIGNIMKFFVPTRFGGFNTYVRLIEFYPTAEDPDLTAVEKARLLLWVGNIQLHCTCPSFLYHYAYVLTQKDAAIVPNDIFPQVRNPNLRGAGCKHMVNTLKIFRFHAGDIAREIKRLFGETRPEDKRPARTIKPGAPSSDAAENTPDDAP